MKRMSVMVLVVLSMLSTVRVETHGGGGGHGGGGHGGGFHGGGGFRGGHGYRGGYGRGGWGGGWGYGVGGFGLGLGLGYGLNGGDYSTTNNYYNNGCSSDSLNVYTNRFGDPRASKGSWATYQNWLANGCQ